jgi:hypothetical protein
MQKLEKYIHDHLDEFDFNEPEEGHFKRFEDRLSQQQVVGHIGHNRSQALKIAALIILLITISVFVFDFATREIRDRFATVKAGGELPMEIREAVQYYDNQTNTQLAAIEKLSENREDAGTLNASALKDIRCLDAATEELKNSLAGNPGNEHILDAIIRNQQMKEAMLQTIISQLSQNFK